MVAFGELREAVEGALRSDSRRVYPALAGGMSPPCLVVRLRRETPATLGGDGARRLWELDVYVLASSGILESSAQRWLDEQVSPEGVEAAIEADRTLGGRAAFARADGLRAYGDAIEVDGAACYGAIVEVTVLA